MPWNLAYMYSVALLILNTHTAFVMLRNFVSVEDVNCIADVVGQRWDLGSESSYFYLFTLISNQKTSLHRFL